MASSVSLSSIFGFLPKWLYIIIIGLSAGFLEEIYYRGLLFKMLLDKNMSVPTIVWISSILFTLAHFEAGLHYMPLYLTSAFIFALFYSRFRTIWPLIIAHSFVDIYYSF